MKPIWKWVLGVVIVLVVGAGVFFAFHGMYASHSARLAKVDDFRFQQYHDFERGDGRGEGFGKDKFRGPKDEFNQRLPKYINRGLGSYGYFPLPFLFFSGLLKKLFPLGVLALVAYIAYQGGKKVGAAEMVLARTASEPEIPSAAKKKSRQATLKNE